MRKTLASAFALTALMVSAAEIAENGNFESTKGWRLSKSMRIERSEGHNGSGGLVWESKGPNAIQDFAKQDIDLERGKAYVYTALVRTENFVSKKNGATLCIEWYDKNDKWLAGAYCTGVTQANADWTLVRGITREIPAEAVRIELMAYITPGCSGKVCFDNFVVTPLARPPVDFVFSSVYRHVACEGEVRFNASLFRPDDAPDATARFVYENAKGERTVVPQTRGDARSAVLAIGVKDLKFGKSTVTCELVAASGKVLGAASCPFERVKELPKRRVSIDADKRWIVDGRPFFPLGMYGGRFAGDQLDQYAKGPFNAVMPYQRATREDLDRLQAKGLMGFVALRNELLDTDWARKNKVTTQEQVDAYWRAEINKVKDHPAVLGWYVNDERPVTEVPVRAHLQRDVFEKEDPDHPTWAVLDRTYDLREFIPTFDTLGMDPYPVAQKPRTHIVDMMTEVNAAIFDDVALVNVPQAFDWGWFRKNEASKERFPTEEEIANMSWQHVAFGANGLIAYCYHSLFRDCKDEKLRADYWGRICRAYTPVKDLIPVLLSAKGPEVRGAPKYMPTRTWKKDGEVFVLAVNALDKPQSAELEIVDWDSVWKVAGLAGGAAQDAKVVRGRLKVGLAPLGWAMIRLVEDMSVSTRTDDWRWKTKKGDLGCLIEYGHIQGMCCDETGVYLSYAGGITKFDWQANKLAETTGPTHLGDSFAYKGKVYAVFGLRQPKTVDGRTMRGMVGVYDAATLKLEKSKLFEKPLDGCCVINDIIYASPDPCSKKLNDHAFIQRFDLDLNDLGITEVDFGFQMHFGVQTMATDGRNLYCCCYGGRHNTAVLTPDLKVLGTYHVWGSEGFCMIPESVVGKSKRPYCVITHACGGNMQGWRADPKGNPPQISLHLGTLPAMTK